jgi:hypothetical protein
MRSEQYRPAHPLAYLALAVLCGQGCASNYPEVDFEKTVNEVRILKSNLSMASVRGLAVSASGDLWILSSSEPFVHQFSAEGDHVRSFGSLGVAQDALKYPWSLTMEEAPSKPALLHIWDVGAHEIFVFSTDGTLVSRIPVLISSNPVVTGIEHIAFGVPRKLERYGAGYVLQDETMTVALPVHLAYSRLLNVDSAGRVTNVIADFRRRYSAAAADLAGARALVPIPLWTICRDSVAVFDPYTPAIDWFGPSGIVARSDRLRLSVREISEADRERWTRNWVSWEAAQRGKRLTEVALRYKIDRNLNYRTRYGSTAPPGVTLLCSDEGSLWLQQFSTRHHPVGFGASWLVIQAGQIIERVRFPFGFQPLVVKERNVVGIQSDIIDGRTDLAVASLDNVRTIAVPKQ